MSHDKCGTEYEQRWLQQMRTLLYHNVPRFIEHIGKRGGVSKHEWLWLKCNSEIPTFPIGLMARADEYLLYPKDEEIFNQGLFVLVKAIFTLSSLTSQYYQKPKSVSSIL